DYNSVSKLISDGIINECKIENCSVSPISIIRYVVKGKVQKVSYRKWIRKQALSKRLHGYTRNLLNGNVVVVVAGLEHDVKAFKKIVEQGSPKSKVTEVLEKEWTRPINVGFIIKKTI